ncbi:putative U3 small nucleolar RNA-associated protein 7, partial [Coemansia brasiliensis]
MSTKMYLATDSSPTYSLQYIFACQTIDVMEELTAICPGLIPAADEEDSLLQRINVGLDGNDEMFIYQVDGYLTLLCIGPPEIIRQTSLLDSSSERITGGAFAKGTMASQTSQPFTSNSDHESSDNEAPRRLRDSKRSTKQKSKARKDPEDHITLEIKQKTSKYSRGHDPEATPIKARSKKAQAKLDHAKKRRDDAILEAARSEVLLTEQAGFLEADKMERTYKFTQKQLAEHVDISSANKIFDLKLEDFGPYVLDYTSNGKNMLIGGRKGHLATMDWRN